MIMSDKFAKIFYFVILPVMVVTSALSRIVLALWAVLLIGTSIILTIIGE